MRNLFLSLFTCLFISGTLPAHAVEKTVPKTKTKNKAESITLHHHVIKEIIEILIDNQEHEALASLLSSAKQFNYLDESSKWTIDKKLQEKIKKSQKHLKKIKATLDEIATQTGNELLFNEDHRKDFRNLPLSKLRKIAQHEMLEDALIEGSSYSDFKAGILTMPLDSKKLSFTLQKLKLIPPEIKRLTSLESLDLSVNELIVLPRVITDLPTLKTLNISENKIMMIDNHIGDMKALRVLNIAQNPFTSLPEAFGELWDITDITINRKMYARKAIQDQIQIIKKRRSTIPEAPFYLNFSSDLATVVEDPNF